MDFPHLTTEFLYVCMRQVCSLESTCVRHTHALAHHLKAISFSVDVIVCQMNYSINCRCMTHHYKQFKQWNVYTTWSHVLVHRSMFTHCCYYCLIACGCSLSQTVYGSHQCGDRQWHSVHMPPSVWAQWKYNLCLLWISQPASSQQHKLPEYMNPADARKEVQLARQQVSMRMDVFVLAIYWG